jgi:AraC-like DNA-binding protein
LTDLNFNIWNIIILLCIIQGIVFGLIVLVNKKYFSKTNSYLAFTSFSLSFSNLQYWFLDSKLTTIFPFLGWLRVPCDFLFIPMFYFFVCHYLELKIPRKHKITICLPFIIDFICQIISSINKLIFGGKLIDSKIIYKYLVIEESFSMIFSSLLLLFTIRLVNKYEKENLIYNFEIVKAKTKWVKQILFIGVTVCVFWVVEIYFMMDKDHGLSIYYPLWLSNSFIIYWLSYVGLFQSNLYSERKEIRKELINNSENDNSDVKSQDDKKNISEQSTERIYSEFEAIVQKRYLNPNLSLDDVAKEINITSNYLSQIINIRNITFNDYVNALRVDRVKLMLSEETFSTYTITSIGLEAGFNSNASFYRAFKKHTNMSPSLYRENI